MTVVPSFAPEISGISAGSDQRATEIPKIAGIPAHPAASYARDLRDRSDRVPQSP